ncbi:MAG: hypothetical protein HY657_00115 [Acidobacteria bacterium]|nr:hypothetical protein [Acidobacteriota bacterium]
MILAAAMCAAPLALLASANAVVPARTGGFGEMTCHQCHSENPLNEPSGTIGLSGIPDTYTPGERYLITVTVARPQLVRAGFQVSARFERGERTGRNAGTFEPSDDRTEAVPDDGGRITYIQHTAIGSTVPSPGTGQWTFAWRAPSDPAAPVVFHAAANAANGDGLPLGDFIYTAIATSQPGAP